MALVSPECVGSDHSVLVMNQSTLPTRSITPLPQSYTSVPPVALMAKQFTARPVNGPMRPLEFLNETKQEIKSISGWRSRKQAGQVEYRGLITMLISSRR